MTELRYERASLWPIALIWLAAGVLLALLESLITTTLLCNPPGVVKTTWIIVDVVDHGIFALGKAIVAGLAMTVILQLLGDRLKINRILLTAVFALVFLVAFSAEHLVWAERWGHPDNCVI